MPYPRAENGSPNSPADFFRGAGDVWRGLSFLIAHPKLWTWAIIPFVINTLFFGLAGWGTWHFFGQWLHGHFFSSQSAWLAMFGWLLGAVFWIALAFIVVFCFVPLATLIASPFNDILSEKVEKLYTGHTTEMAFSLRILLKTIAIGLHTSLRLMLVTLGLIACTLPLHLIPGIGSVLATVASSVITIRFLSLQFTAYSMDRRLYTYAQRRDFLRRNRARTIGLGAMAFAIMLVPIANALFISISAVAGTLLFCDTQPVGEPARVGRG